MDRRVVSDLTLGVVLTLALFLAALTLPFFGLGIGFFTPLPIAYYFRKAGRNCGALIVAIVAIVLAASAGLRTGTLFLVEFAAVGFALSESVRMRLTFGRGILLPVFVSLSGSVLLIMAFQSSAGTGLTEMIGDHVRQNISETIEAYKKAGLHEEQLGLLTDFRGQLESLILNAFPSLVFVATASAVLINLLLLKDLLKKKGIEDYGIDLTVWRSPEPLVWTLIAGGFLLLLENEMAGFMGLNLLIITGAVYFLQGMTIVAFYLKKMRVPGFLRFLGYFLIFVQQIFTLIVVSVGLFDLWFDFRRLKKGGLDADHSN